MKKNPCFRLLATAGFTAVIAVGNVHAVVLYRFTTNDATITPVDDGYDPAEVSVTVAPGVTAPGAIQLPVGNVGLNRFWNSEWAGFSLSAPDGRGTTLEEGEFSTAYFAFTVSADPGLLLSLESLTFGSARGGGDPALQTRRFELFASINGAPFDYAGGPLLSIVNETGTRPAPVTRSADLSGAAYQDIQSITFRYYPLTPASGNSMDFTGMTLDGTVIPEPSTAALIALSLTGLLRRRR